MCQPCAGQAALGEVSVCGIVQGGATWLGDEVKYIAIMTVATLEPTLFKRGAALDNVAFCAHSPSVSRRWVFV